MKFEALDALARELGLHVSTLHRAALVAGMPVEIKRLPGSVQHRRAVSAKDAAKLRAHYAPKVAA